MKMKSKNNKINFSESFRGKKMTTEIECFANQELLFIPNTITQNIHIKELDFSKNQISKLGDEFGNLLNLKVRNS